MKNKKINETELVIVENNERFEKNPEDISYLYNQANTLTGLGKWADAIPYYEKRIAAGGLKAEIYMSRYLRAYCIHKMNGFEAAKDSYLEAWMGYPYRLESLYRIVEHYRKAGEYTLGYGYGMMAYGIIWKFPKDGFVNHSIQASFKDELAVCCFFVGDHELAIRLNNAVLEIRPDDKRVRGNLEASLAKLTPSHRYNHTSKKICFISGLPRSGSTLISTLLNQNPRFCAEPSSPLLNLLLNVEKIGKDEMCTAFPRPDAILSAAKELVYGFYTWKRSEVCFDKNRGWSGYVPQARRYITDNPKIICMVRSVREILTSFIRLMRLNGYPHDSFVDKNLVEPIDDNARCRYLLEGTVGQSIIDLLRGLEEHPNELLLVSYNKLVENPSRELRRIYKFIDEPYYEDHQFHDLPSGSDDSAAYGLSGMHIVKPTIEATPSNNCEILSDFILTECKTNPVLKQLEEAVARSLAVPDLAK